MAVDGRPADCVRLAIKNLMRHRPGLVLSGINAGANVGINVFYSGTVAAAAEAAMLGIPAVAFSAGGDEEEIDFDRPAAYCRTVLDRLLSEGLTGGDLINVNVPARGAGAPKGIRVVRQSTAEIEDAYHLDVDGAGRQAYRLGPEYSHGHQPETDVTALGEGYITITPLHIDMTNSDRLSAMAQWRWDAALG